MKLFKLLFVVMIIAISGCSDDENPYSPTPNPKHWGTDDLHVPQK
jgi:hypothetical protein